MTKSLILLVSLITALVYTGCAPVLAPQPDQTTFHVLGTGLSSGAYGEALTVENSVPIHIRSVTLPVYLDVDRIVKRTGEGQIAFYPNMRWSEPLTAGIARTLANSMVVSSNEFIITYHPSPVPVYQCRYIDVYFRSFEEVSMADVEPYVLLEGEIVIADSRSGDRVTRRFSIREQSSTSAPVAGYDLALSALSQEIISAL